MARKEERIILHKKDKNGDTIYQFPYIKGDCIETPVPITAGGHGGKTAQEARTNLGIRVGSLVDPGFIGTYAGNTVPEGWLACNGAAVSRTTYAELYAKIGTTHGAGDGSTTFNLPNMGTQLVSSITNSNIPIKGTGKALGLTNGKTNYGLGYTTGNYPAHQSCTGNYGADVGTANSGTYAGNSGQIAYGVTTDASKSGMRADMTATKTTVKYCIKY